MGPLNTRLATLAVVAATLAGCISGSTLPPAVESKEEAAQYNMQLGVSYLRQGDYRTARAKLERALADNDRLVPAWTALGLVMEQLGDAREAEKSYRRAVSLDGSDPDALNALGAFLCRSPGNEKEALRYFDRAIAVPLTKSDANRPMLYTNAGTCAKRADLERAEAYLRSAVQADPGYPDALLQLADVTFARGNALQGRAFLERYFAAGRVTSAALWLGVRIEESLGGTKAAADYATRLKEKFPESAEYGQLVQRTRSGG